MFLGPVPMSKDGRNETGQAKFLLGLNPDGRCSVDWVVGS